MILCDQLTYAFFRYPKILEKEEETAVPRKDEVVLQESGETANEDGGQKAETDSASPEASVVIDEETPMLLSAENLFRYDYKTISNITRYILIEKSSQLQ